MEPKPVYRWETIESRQFTSREVGNEVGRSSIEITCPYCHQTCIAYKWSLAGSGKKCECGVVHRWFGGVSVKRIRVKTTRNPVTQFI